MSNDVMTKKRLVIIGLLLHSLPVSLANAEALPVEPVEIGIAPQFLFDRYVVDNHWAIKYKKETVRRVFHAPKKHE